MDFRKWQEEQKKLHGTEESAMLANALFFGRKNELIELHKFIESKDKKIFCLYGVPMIGKSTLVKEFTKTIQNYEITIIKLFNPENPEITLENAISNIDWTISTNKLIVIENFEESLIWKGDKEHLHEIKFQKVKSFLEDLVQFSNVKFILESRFQIKPDFASKNILAELPNKQLGKIERQELFIILNDIYRNNSTTYQDFEELCDRLNDHVWLIELAMQNDWIFENVREAAYHPESITQLLWKKLQFVINRLPISQKTLLCAFSLITPISEVDLKNTLGTLPLFAKKDELDLGLLSLRKKLLLVYEPQKKFYEVNTFLREICFTYMKDQKEMKVLEQLAFFKNVPKPKYNHILQAQQKGDYHTFFRLLKEKRKRGEYLEVIEILQNVYWTDAKKEVVLNEIGITYKWQGNYAKAIEIFRELIDYYNHVPAFTELAIIYKEQGNYNEAIKLLKLALSFNSEDVKTLNELAIIYKIQGHIEDAIEIFKGLIEKHDHIPAYDQLAIIYKMQKKYPDAIDIIDRALNKGIKDSHLLMLKKDIEKIYSIIPISDGLENLKSFFISNLRRAVLKQPENETDIQNVVEQLLIGKNLKKGIDYDREVGRVKVSIKEFKPDFVFLKISLALEIKLSKTKAKSKEIVDEINADISAYSKLYNHLLFLVYDMGSIIDENEFKNGIDNNANIQLIVIKN